MILGFTPGPREEDPPGGRGANTLGSAPGRHGRPQAASTSRADLGPKGGGRPGLDPPGEGTLDLSWSWPGPTRRTRSILSAGV